LQTSLVEFESALKKGLGRAMLLLSDAPGHQEYGAALLHACTVNLVYDRQCEEDRVAWLYQLIRATGQIDRYCTELLRRLATTGEAADSIDMIQVFGILCMIAAEDPEFDRRVLRDFLLGADWEKAAAGCIYQFVWLEGIAGLLLCVRQFHSVFVENSAEGGWIFRSLVDSLITRDGAEIAAAAVRSARSECAELDDIMSRDELASRPTVQAAEADQDYAAIKAGRNPSRGFPHAWVKAASNAELAQAAHDLLAEHDSRWIQCYLRIFWSRDFPRSPKDLFRFVQSADRRIAWAALRALRRLSHPDIRTLALETIAEGTRPGTALRLLARNFEAGDLQAIETMIQRLELDEATWHDVGMAVLDLLERSAVLEEESRDLLLRLYEEGPCSLCREGIVARLFAAGNVPDWIAAEARFDAEPRIAKLFNGTSEADRSGSRA
jgi:hypothetical protein